MARRVWLSGVLLSAACISTGVFAAEKSVVGKIDSIDAAKQLVVLSEQRLDVIRKTEITLNGRTAALGELKPGQEATVKFDDSLEVAMSIVANDAAAPQPVVSNDPRMHLSTAWTKPDLAQEAKSAPRFRVDQSQLDTKEWQDAIRKALNHQGDRGFYTLLRVRVDDTPGEQIQAMGTKLKEFTEEYNGAGGEYRVLQNGEFLLWEHINSDRRQKNRDPLQLGAISHGRSELWAEVPQVGVLNVLGDVILNRCPVEEMGVLSVKLHGVRGLAASSLVIGPVVVGGPYGKKFAFDIGRDFELHLPPGDYKLLLPDFDMVKSRWDVTVTPQKTTRLDFDVKVQLRSTDTQRASAEKIAP